MHAEKVAGRRIVPIVALLLALAYLASAAWPALMPAVVVAAAIGGCALVLLRRPSRALRLALGGIALWMAAGLAGAFLLHARPLPGLAWVLLFVYFLPLPLIPWLYARTFPTEHAIASGDTVASPDSGPRTPDLGLSP